MHDRPTAPIACKVSLAVVIAVSIGCGSKRDGNDKTHARSPRSEPQMPNGIRSPEFHLQIAAVYQQYGDTATAAQHYEQALAAANPEQRAYVRSMMAQASQNRGDRAGAIAALEQGFAECEAQDRTRSVAGPLSPARGLIGLTAVETSIERIAMQLGELYVQDKAFDKAEQLYEKVLDRTENPLLRRQLLARLIGAYADGGKLDVYVAELERAVAAAEQPPVEKLWRLAIAYAAQDARGAGDQRSGDVAATGRLDRRIRVYEQLYELYPDDAQVRDELAAAYRRAGRAEDAARLATTKTPAAFARLLGNASTP